MVDHNTMDPGREIRSWNKTVSGNQGFRGDILGQVVGGRAVPG
jgi:hypothetical protein